MILVPHAYSARNSGDGLLVRLTVERIQRARPGEDLVILALDPQSFEADLLHVVAYPSSAGRISRRMRFVSEAARLNRSDSARLFASANGIVAVGGGYLRARNVVSVSKFTLAHLTQLRLAARTDAPRVYLPQSIGPLPIGLSTANAKLLQGASHVHVRDDKSSAFLKDLENVVRTPDLAVLAAGQAGPPQWRSADGTLHLIGRDLNSAPYCERLINLARDWHGEVKWWIQSSGAGNDDGKFYKTLGVRPAGLTSDLWADPDIAGVLVATRLHGALEGLLNGFQTVHLSYERKGWGAYADLGISPWVHNAHSFSTVEVLRQATEFDGVAGERYKGAVSSKLVSLAAASEALDESLVLDLAQ